MILIVGRNLIHTKRWPVIALVFELLIAAVLSQVGFLRRHDFDRAFFASRQSATPEAKAEMDRQRRLNELVRWEFSIIGFGAMAAVTLLASFGYERLHRRSSVIPG